MKIQLNSRILPMLALFAGVICVAVVILITSSDNSTYRVRVVFANAFGLTKGLDVRIAGVKVGEIESLDLTRDNHAAVVLRIDNKGFRDFRKDARCSIRPQSLIGERFVECQLTQQQNARSLPPPLAVIPGGEKGAGQRLLAMKQTVQPVDLDLINNIMRLPVRQRLAIVLNELGLGFYARASDIRAAIRRADPALAQTEAFLKIIDSHNQELERFVVEADRVLEPLARDRHRVQSFLDNAQVASQTIAQKRGALQASVRQLPAFLRELRPTLADLERLSSQATPPLQDIRAAAPELSQFIRGVGPITRAGTPALRSLATALGVTQTVLARNHSLIDNLGALGRSGKPLVSDLSVLMTSVKQTGGIDEFLKTVFYLASASNGYDAKGRYYRIALLLNNCSNYAVVTDTGSCNANFRHEKNKEKTNDDRALANLKGKERMQAAAFDYLLGSGK